MASESVRRRMLLVGAGLVIAVAAILALGVIPLSRADASLHGWPDTASPVLWLFVIANALVAAALLGATRTRRGGCASTVLLATAGSVAPAVGFVLLLTVLDLYSEGNVMQGATVSLLACAGGDLAAAVLAFTAVVVRLRQPPSQ